MVLEQHTGATLVGHRTSTNFRAAGVPLHHKQVADLQTHGFLATEGFQVGDVCQSDVVAEDVSDP